MPFLLAHKDDCDIGLHGPTVASPVTETRKFQDVATLCTCGGLYLRINEPEDNPRDDARIYTIPPAGNSGHP